MVDSLRNEASSNDTFVQYILSLSHFMLKRVRRTRAEGTGDCDLFDGIVDSRSKIAHAR